MPRIAINGFGRIGRQVLRAGWGRRGFDVVAINDLVDAKTLAYLLKYDTNYGVWHEPVSARGDTLIIGRKKIRVFLEREPGKLPWKRMKVQVVIESTGVFTTQDAMQPHIDAGAKWVVLSAPAKDNKVPTYVLGANDEKLRYENGRIINNASCTTNSTSPVVAVMDEAFGVKRALLTTVHGYTADQELVDAPHRDLRRGRAAAENIVPTSTGAAKATEETLPSVRNKFDGIAIRVPVPVGSLSDITFLVKKRVTVDMVNSAFCKAAKSKRWKNILTVTDDPIVSSDIVGDPHSAIVDLGLTRVVGGDFVKVVAWYDNEWGYSNRLAELVLRLK